MTTVMLPKRFESPLVNPAPGGLFAATIWSDEAEPLRWLPAGVEVVPFNRLGEGGFGIWSAAWCAAEVDLGPDDRKLPGTRPEALLPFMPITTWAADECDMRPESRAEVRVRAQQIHRLREPITVEEAFAARMLDDIGALDSADDIVGAVGHLDELFAVSGTVGVIHARPSWQASAAQANLLVRMGTGLKTPGGNTWVFGGGYVAGLGDTLVATSPVFGFRQPVVVGEGITAARDGFRVIVERSLVIGYESVIGAVEVGP